MPPRPTPPRAPGLPLGDRLARLWGGAEAPPGRPGPKASLTLDKIAEAGIALADAHGIAGASLVRVAERLGVTTNALYRYLGSRDELEQLLRERALGRPDPAQGGDWADRVRHWAYALRERFAAHPWLPSAAADVPIGPNGLAWLNALLAALDGCGLAQADALRAAALLDGFVKTSSLTAAELAARSTPIADAGTVADVLGALLADRGLDHVAALVRDGLFRPADSNDADFAFGIEIIIAGLRRA
jgi:AcrR family transcriptional regulator